MPVSHVLLAMVANLAWGFNFIAGKFGVEHFPAILFTSMRFGLMAVLLVPFMKRVRTREQFGKIVQIALLMGVLHFACMFSGLGRAADISSVAILSQLYVPFATILAIVLLKETVGWRRASAIGAAFLGVLVIGFDPTAFRHPDAVVLVAAGALFMAINNIVARTLSGVDVFTLQAWMGLIAAPTLFAGSMILEDGQWEALASAGALEWSSVAYSAIVTSIIGHGCIYFLLQRHPVSVVAPYMLLTPILAVIFGVLIWGDVLTWKLVLGGILTLAGVAVITLRSARSARPAS
ncbi:DMT family transporter [Oceanibacterium hippocampi]|uniref:Putative amino-acid metabolite efflux pump n=1 Tax=Oceanibacterium hippocampi TaxID=745714 RepID=A0A1Y5SBR3_9PROT|nr:DMT family transporter [Oceanibacterium hippocampi]SLN37151.1 putative amino-acid metabolite efflux pump [Oceanibacterium hippocampi]